jgi:predicted Zn-dependent protease
MTMRAAMRGALTALLVLIPAVAGAQGIAAWDFEKGGGFSGNPKLGGLATGAGVASPLGFKESTPTVTGFPPAKFDPKVEYAKGFTDVNIGRFASAEQAFKNALSVEPRNPKTLFMLGEARIGLGDLPGAAEAFEKAVQYAPKQIVIRTEYAVALAKLGQTDKAQSQMTVLKARADACGASCADAGDLKAALDRVQATLATAPRQNS